jgi:hypothetical protein
MGDGDDRKRGVAVKKERIEIAVEVQWGSPAQRKIGMQELHLVFETWNRVLSLRHKGNHAEITFGAKTGE